MESWFHLQAIPDDKGVCLEYILDFLSTTDHWKWNQWTPACVTTDNIAATKKSTKSLLDHLASQMDHTVSQRCQIYQLEDVQTKPGETLDELVDHLRTLTKRCNFPMDEEKEQNIQFCLVCALTDSELVKKLLTLALKPTTAKMLETCRTHIAIADNLNAMDLGAKAINAVNKQSQFPQSHPQQQQQKILNPQKQHACRNCTKSHAPGRTSNLPRTSHANHVAELVTGMSHTEAPPVDRRIQTRSHPDMGPKVESKSMTHTVDFRQ